MKAKSDQAWAWAFRRAEQTAEGLDLFPPPLPGNADEHLRSLRDTAARWGAGLTSEGLIEEMKVFSQISYAIEDARGALLRGELSLLDVEAALAGFQERIQREVVALRERAERHLREPSA